MPGPSGYTTAFTRPDPLDPNDRKRQQTQARPADFPYDQPVSYGKAVGTDMGGAAYQSGARSAPPVPKKLRPSDWQPKDPWNLTSEVAEDVSAPYGPGDQADDAMALGYGSHGRMGEDDEVDMDDLNHTFRSMFDGPVVAVPLSQLLSIVLGAESDDGSDDGCAGDILTADDDGEDHVFAPGAEDDPETL